MLNGSIWNKILIFALPVAANAILEQLFNASDIAVVGNFTGAGKTVAVEAVGANSLLNVPNEVFLSAFMYLRKYLLGMPVILLYNFEAAIFRSIGDTKTPLFALLFCIVEYPDLIRNYQPRN